MLGLIRISLRPSERVQKDVWEGEHVKGRIAEGIHSSMTLDKGEVIEARTKY